MRKTLFVIALIFVLAVIVLLAMNNVQEKTVINVGLVGLMSFGSTVGFTQHENAMFFLEDYPNTLIRPVAIDDKLNPELSERIVREAIDQGTRFFITSHPSNCALAIMNLFNDSKALMLVTASATPVLSRRDDSILRLLHDTEQEQKMIAHLVHKMPGKRLLVLQDDGNLSYTDPALKIFSQELESLGKWKTVTHKVTVSHFDPEKIEPLVAGEFDLLYILAGSYQKSIGNLAQLFHKSHDNVPIVLTPWAYSRGIMDAAGPAASRILDYNLLATSYGKQAAQDFIRRLDSRFGQITPIISVGVRQALELLDQAFSKGHTTPESVKNYLLTLGTHQTTLGQVSFDRFGDLISDIKTDETTEGQKN